MIHHIYKIEKCYNERTESAAALVEHRSTLKAARDAAKCFAEGGWIGRLYVDGKLVETWKRKKVHVYRVKNMAEAK